VTISRETGLDVIKADWLMHQAKLILELRDEELESIKG
jgi:hypothetical protein